MSDVLDVLVKSREYISDARRWCRGLFRQDPYTGEIQVCGLGAIALVRGYALKGYEHLEGDPAVQVLATVALAEGFIRLDSRNRRRYNNWVVWKINDLNGHKAILALFDRAIEIQRARDQEFSAETDVDVTYDPVTYDPDLTGAPVLVRKINQREEPRVRN